jgi:hypothetical protein
VCAEQTAPTDKERSPKGSTSLGLKPQELIGLVPIVASGFAVAYNVGYFLAYDISWLPFFSLSEHVVFALRALPIAIGASVAFLIGIIDPPQDLRLRFWFEKLWILALVVAAVLAFVNAHIGLSLVLLLVTIGAIRHRKTPSQNPSVNILYWGISMMLLSLMVGYVSAKGGKLIWETEKRLGVKSFSIAPSMCVELKRTETSAASPSEPDPYVGQAIFVGSEAVLFREYGGVAHLFRWGDIQKIYECSPADAAPKGRVSVRASLLPQVG